MEIYKTKTDRIKGRNSSTVLPGDWIPHSQEWREQPEGKWRKRGLNTVDQRDPANTHGASYQQQHTHSSQVHTWHLPGQTLGHRLRLNRVKKTDIIDNIFSDLNWMKLEISNISKPGAFTNMWKLNPGLLNNQWIKEEITGEIGVERKPKTSTLELIGCSESRAEGDIYSYERLN